MTAIIHQAMNIWRNPEIDAEDEEYIVLQTHDYNSFPKRRDDKEFVEFYKVKGTGGSATTEKVSSIN